jgi:hypothetical protein
MHYPLASQDFIESMYSSDKDNQYIDTGSTEDSDLEDSESEQIRENIEYYNDNNDIPEDPYLDPESESQEITVNTGHPLTDSDNATPWTNYEIQILINDLRTRQSNIKDSTVKKSKLKHLAFS